MHSYVLESYYTDASGENYRGCLIDPNIISCYVNEIFRLNSLNCFLDFQNLEDVSKLTNISVDILEKILEVESIYKRNLMRR